MLRLGIDLGHGGPDHSDGCAQGAKCSACGTKAGADRGVVEATYVRDLGERLITMIPDRVVEVVRLNAVDESIGCRERGRRAHEANCHAVISIHINASKSRRTSGAHFFILPEDLAGRRMAADMAYAWPQVLRRQRMVGEWREGRYYAGAIEPTTRDMWSRAHYLLGCYRPIPTVLVECFYATNPGDLEAALDPWVRIQMLGALLLGVGAAGML